MNRTQLGQLWDSFPEGQRDMPKAQFIREALAFQDSAANGKILAQMVEGKQRARQGRIQKAQIDAALAEGGAR